MRTLHLRTLAILFAPALATLAGAAPQEPPGPEPAPEPPTPNELLEAMEGPQDELVELFGKVEGRLREIDRMLYDASAGKPIEGAEESGIGDLLEATRSASEEVLSGIDRILEIAMERQQQQQQSSGGGSGSPQDGSPMDRPEESPGDREQTPDSPASERPEDQPSGEQDGRPQSPEESQDDPQNRLGNDPPVGPTERVAPGTGDDAWGDLPVHVRDLFRAQGGGDLPPRYRDWIDAYYRRLNQKP